MIFRGSVGGVRGVEEGLHLPEALAWPEETGSEPLAAPGSATSASAPIATRIATRVVLIPWTLQTQLSAEDLLHHLVRAPADRAQAGVADGALDAVLPHVAVAAVDLKALVGDLQQGALREELGHRDLANRVVAFGEEP